MNTGKKSKQPEDHCNLYFNEAVTGWDEAIPLGNGLIGCLVWGNGYPLRLSLDRGDIWDTRPIPETLGDEFKYENLIELAEHKAAEKINRIFDYGYGRAYPTKIPAGRLGINYGLPGDKVESSLSLKDASARINLVFGEKQSKIETYLHATKLFGCIRISGDADLPQIQINPPQFGTGSGEAADEDTLPEDGISPESLERLKYPPLQWFEEGCLKGFIQKTSQSMEYGVFIGQRKTGNTLNAVYYVASGNDGENWFENAKRKILAALDTGYAEGMRSHKKWWSGFWSKSSVTLYDKSFEKQWYITNYLFGSCSRKGFPPMPLQGLWTADDGRLPPWKGDYHNDLNTQMSYYHYLKANHLEEGKSFIDFLWKLLPAARKFAREFFDAPGINLPSVMDMDGKPLGGWPMYSLSLTNQIWLCKSFDDYWKATGDIEFLNDKAYPYFKETALCILRWLKIDEAGKLVLPLSSSPEIHGNSTEAWLTPNSNYDLSLLGYLFLTLAKMSDVLGNNAKKEWLDKYRSLPGLAVNNCSVLMLSPDESLKESHRHFAHAMAIHPLKLLDYDGNQQDRKIVDATIYDLEALGAGWWVGYSFTWMAELYAIQLNGEAAAFQLKLFWENFCSQNGFHLNGDYKNRGLSNYKYRPFTLEGNMCAADALQEMLLQTRNSVITVFPAIPEDWKKYGTSFNSFRSEGGILVSSSIKNRQVRFIDLKAEKDCNLSLKNVFNSDKLSLCINSRAYTIICRSNENLELTLQAGEECTITPL